MSAKPGPSILFVYFTYTDASPAVLPFYAPSGYGAGALVRAVNRDASALVV